MPADPAAAKALFLDVVALEDHVARAALLDERCGGDAELRARVEALLAANDRALADAGTATFGGAPGDEAAGPTADYPHTDERAGAVIGGKYTLIEPIGEGGMGSVWRARQTEPVKRFVAVKLIKAGMDSKQVLARFEAERQALALMDHPHIAKVLDGGLHDGRPFFVMELVKGVPITEYCDRCRLTPKQRLELFVPVCQAIQHAHMKGVIHRDIKPSNVLIALYDDKPVVKVIDFGVAKATGAALTERTIDTGFGGVVGTPQYMSPEQATFNNLDIDTRSDVYALGVLLYELLVGSPPFAQKELAKKGLLEILRVVREEEPPRPSTNLSTADALPTLSASRGTEPKELTALLRNELDWIVMKALEKDRARRYESANGFAADVQRYLSGEQVQAVPPSLGYRLRKAYRRNRPVILGAGAFAAVLLVATGVSFAFGLLAKEAEADAIRARNAEAAQTEIAVKAGGEAADERDKTKSALTQLEEQQRRQRAEQYSWDMQTVPSVWEVGNVVQVRHLLDRQPADLRGFEWHFWNRQIRGNLDTYSLPDRPRTPSLSGWKFSVDGTRLAASTYLRQGPVGPTVTVWDVAAGKKLLTHTLKDENAPAPEKLSWGYTITNAPTLVSEDGRRVALYRNVGPIDPATGRTTRTASHLQVVDVDSQKVLLEHDDRKAGQFKLGDVWSALFSLDGRKLAVVASVEAPVGKKSARKAVVHIWDLDVGGAPVTLESSGLGNPVFSPDGKRILLPWRDGAEGGTVTHDTVTGKELGRWTTPFGYVPPSSPDGLRVAGIVAGPPPKDGSMTLQTLHIWDAAAGKELHSLTLPVGSGEKNFARATGLSFSRDGSRLLVSGTTDTGNVCVVIFDPVAGKRLCTVTTPGVQDSGMGLMRGSNPAPILSPNCRHLAVAAGNVITIWDPTTGRPRHTLRGHTSNVVAYSFTTTGRLRSLDMGGTLKEWDVGLTESVVVPLAPDRPEGLRPGRTTVIFSADGRWVATGTRQSDPNSAIQVRELAGKRGVTLTPRPQASARLWRLALSADGGRVALLRQSAENHLKEGTLPTQPDDLTVWDVASGKELFYAEVPASSIALLAMPDISGTAGLTISPDGATVAVGSPQMGMDAGTVIRLFDGTSGRVVRSFRGADSASWVLSFSPDGKRLAALGSPLRPSPDEFKALTPPFANLPLPKLVVWDVATGDSLVTVDLERNGSGTALCWSPDGSRLAVAKRVGPTLIAIYDSATGKQVSAVESASGGVSTRANSNLVFSSDGRRVALEVPPVSGTPGSVPVVGLWDVNSGKELLTLRPEPTALSSFGPSNSSTAHLSFTPDGNRLQYCKHTQQGGDTIVITTWDATPILPGPKKP